MALFWETLGWSPKTRLLPSDLLKSKIIRQIYYFTYLQLLPRFAEKAQ